MTHNTSEEASVGLLTSDEVYTGFISGATFTNKPIQYAVVDGLAIFEWGRQKKWRAKPLPFELEKTIKEMLDNLVTWAQLSTE